MKIRILPSCPAAPDQMYLTTFVVEDRIAIDAGCLGIAGGPAEESDVAHVFLTHSHADHIGSLPLHVEERYDRTQRPVHIHGHSHSIDCLREDVFNDRVWPNLIRLRTEEQQYLELHALESEKPVEVDGIRVTPVAVDHIVPTFGYVLEDEAGSVVFGGDSGPTDRIWEVASSRPDLRAAFIEVSFPDRLAKHAALTKHLTPSLVAAEIEKLPATAQVVAVHIKPAYRSEVVAELESLGLARLRIGAGGREYRF